MPEMTLPEAARRIGISGANLRGWRVRGKLKAHRHATGPWLVDSTEVKRFRRWWRHNDRAQRGLLTQGKRSS